MTKKQKVWRIIMLTICILMFIWSLVQLITNAFFAPEIAIKEDTANWMFKDADSVHAWLHQGFTLSTFYWLILSSFSLERLLDAKE